MEFLLYKLYMLFNDVTPLGIKTTIQNVDIQYLEHIIKRRIFQGTSLPFFFSFLYFFLTSFFQFVQFSNKVRYSDGKTPSLNPKWSSSTDCGCIGFYSSHNQGEVLYLPLSLSPPHFYTLKTRNK